MFERRITRGACVARLLEPSYAGEIQVDGPWVELTQGPAVPLDYLGWELAQIEAHEIMLARGWNLVQHVPQGTIWRRGRDGR